MTYNKLFYSVAALGLALQICALSPVAAMQQQEDNSSSAKKPVQKPVPSKPSEQSVEQISHGSFLAPQHVSNMPNIVTSALYTDNGTPIVERHNGQIPEHQLLIFSGKLKHTNGIVKSAPSKSSEAPKTELKKEKRALKDRKEGNATKSAKELKKMLEESAQRRASSTQQQSSSSTQQQSSSSTQKK